MGRDFELPVYALQDPGHYVVDDRSVDYAALAELDKLLREAEQRLGLVRPSDVGPAVRLPRSSIGGSGNGIQPCGGPGGERDLWLEPVTVTNQAGCFRIHTPEPGAAYDLFATTKPESLRGRIEPYELELAAVDLAVPDQPASHKPDRPAIYSWFARTNDSDGGGLSDAFEQRMTHTDPEDPADDRIGPGVGIVVVDSVATEQPANRTARWRVWLQGGYLVQPLIVACRRSGSARLGTDFQLAPATPNPPEVCHATPGQPAVEIALDTVQDLEPERTETVTLTLTTNASPCEIEPGQSSATVWILEPYTKTFIMVADFNLGVRIGLLAAQGLGDGQLQFQSQLPSQFPFLAVACSGQGTLVRINTTNGQVVGEYLTAPTGLPHPPDPSRT
ncbi:MAG: hypothetical protein N2438_11105, partial [Limisphaera sp.]|nr:hypothetical protein [Limisphaera sp.]